MILRAAQETVDVSPISGVESSQWQGWTMRMLSFRIMPHPRCSDEGSAWPCWPASSEIQSKSWKSVWDGSFCSHEFRTAVQENYTHWDLDHLKAWADIVDEIWEP
jgi:hypothetical protein